MNASAVKDRFYMQMALDLALKGTGYTSPNPLVGAVVVKDQKVVGRGYNERYGEAHAEVNALRQAGVQARGATLYVTLEPCNHTGRTPPCTATILAAGIRRVVVAMGDPNPGVKGGGSTYLRHAGIDVVEGVAEEAARRQNPFFLKHIQTGMPFVILKCAATLDGRIATRTGDSRWISGPESRRLVHRLRARVDAVLVGIRTVLADDPSLTVRDPDLAGKGKAMEAETARHIGGVHDSFSSGLAGGLSEKPPSASTTGSFSMRCCPSRRSASARVVPS